MREKFENILLIAGSGQNVGKTTFACQIIANEKAKNPVAIKITPHMHKITKGLEEIEKAVNGSLFEETDNTTHKDSSLFLQNGAVKSYVILANDSGLKESFTALQKLLPSANPIVIESAALVNIIQPGLFVVVFSDQANSEIKRPSDLQKADLIVVSNGKRFLPAPEKISFKNGWTIK